MSEFPNIDNNGYDVDNDAGDSGAGHAGVDCYVVTGGVQICTHHGLPEWLKMRIFYDKLNSNTKNMVDASSRGILMKKFLKKYMSTTNGPLIVIS